MRYKCITIALNDSKSSCSESSKDSSKYEERSKPSTLDDTLGQKNYISLKLNFTIIDISVDHITNPGDFLHQYY